MAERNEIQNTLIRAGIKNLKAWGYEMATFDNIMTDDVLKAFFRAMLTDNLGHGKNIDEAINKLIDEIDSQQNN